METYFLKKNIKLKKILLKSFKKNIKKPKLLGSHGKEMTKISTINKFRKNKSDYKWAGVMTKAAFLLKTFDIKTSASQAFTSVKDEAFFYIKDSNFHRFKEVVDKKHLNLETEDSEGNTMLNVAVLSNNFQIASYLLELGANVNSSNVS